MTQTLSAPLAPGQTVGGYRVERVEPLPHIGGTYVELTHLETGARHIHVACDDDNNAFAVAFPTIPKDSTGVAHILEHIVLCGSQRYPVRDPFFSMIPRSLNTFMNAITYGAHTVYPFSTRNARDFENLLSVYLDATFFPLLAPDAFLQEAHRLEFAVGDDPNSPLERKGVVYNEMKGAMASVPSIMGRAIGRAVFPALTYANNSGGDPKHIPELTFEALRAFHARHYHPSNAYFYTYGNLPLEPALAAIEEVIGRFERQEFDARIPDQPRFEAPVELTVPYPIAQSEMGPKKSQVLLAWLTTAITDFPELLALRVLARVLLANAASPLRRALLESGLGSALADGTGFHEGYREAVFAAGLKDVAGESVPRVEALVLDTLRNLAENGLDAEMVDATVHRLELESREVSNSGFPYALKLLLGPAMGAYLHGGDPYRAMRIETDLALLGERRRAPGFFEGLIRRYLLDNPHRARVVLAPDPELTERAAAEERAELEAVREELGLEAEGDLVAGAAALKARQDAPHDVSVLPTLELSEVPLGVEGVEGRVEEIAGCTVGLFAQPTNGLGYLDFQVSFAGLEDRLKDLVPVFAFVAPKMGAGNSDYLTMARRIDASTGGMSAGAGVRVSPADLAEHEALFTLSGKALLPNAEAFFGVVRDLVTALHFDRTHLRNLLGQYRAGLEARVVGAGHAYAMRLAGAQLSAAGRLRERLDGLAQLAVARRLAALDEAGLDGLIADLTAVRDALFRRPARVCVTAEAGMLETWRGRVAELLEAMPEGANPILGATREEDALHRRPVARTTAVPVAYDAKLFRTVPYAHPDAPALMALGDLLRWRYLHPEVREKGGAYGGFAVADREGGTFALASYRDPHITRTLGVFDGAARWVLEADLEGEMAEAVKEAVLAACADVDPLLSPDSKGRARFFGDALGYTLALKEEFKRRLLAVTAHDLKRVAGTYLGGEGAVAVISNPEKVEAANAELGGRLEVAAV